ncbi:LPS-assembly protein LptD [Selenomonas sp.]|uniref:LPS-assembly protein LptD n=1 Tax=Selenomonas sp. TaxID=2053611 RepID=UPI0025DC62C0|nr:LPS-assembly protein LptD [Selenomonas sp.]MCI6284426.1 LPS-assembly protein LptD [Selenomonas sp.]
MNFSFPYKKLSLCLGVLATALPLFTTPPEAEAKYHSPDTEGGVQRLDYIEDEHRRQREEALTEAQKKAVAEAAAVQANVRYPADPSDPDTAAKPAPTMFEGDELTYDQVTGDFQAAGKVHIVQADGHTFDTDDSVIGNLLKQQVELPGYAHIVQVTPGQTRVDLEGYQAFYRYGAKTGSLTNAKGKVGHQFVSGKRFEFYPDHMIIHDGTETKCSAKHPDYQVAAETIEYWPDKYTIYHNAKFLIKGNVVAQKKRHIVKAGEEDTNTDWIPRMGYDETDGYWAIEDYSWQVAPRVSASFYGKAMTKKGMRSNEKLAWGTKKLGTFSLAYGYYEDGDYNWVKRKPELAWSYDHGIYGTKWSYGLGYSIGRWQNMENGIESTHQTYSLSFARQPFILGHDWYLTLSTGYNITKESYNDSTVRGMTFDSGLFHEFDDRFTIYAAYSYSKYTSEIALFDFDLDSYSRKFQGGLSWRFTPIDRLVAACDYDMQNKQMDDINYYWFHDMHCTQFILRYQWKYTDETSNWSIRYQFTPW